MVPFSHEFYDSSAAAESIKRKDRLMKRRWREEGNKMRDIRSSTRVLKHETSDAKQIATIHGMFHAAEAEEQLNKFFSRFRRFASIEITREQSSILSHIVESKETFK